MLPNQTYNNTYNAKYNVFPIGKVARMIPLDLDNPNNIDRSKLLTMQGATVAAPVAQPSLVSAVSVKNFPRTQRVSERARFGYFQNISINAAAGVDQLILQQPTTDRIILIIQNNGLANNLYVSFGAAATSLNGLKLYPGGSILFDSVVPQDDIHINADGGGTTGVLIYANKGINDD